MDDKKRKGSAKDAAPDPAAGAPHSRRAFLSSVWDITAAAIIAGNSASITGNAQTETPTRKRSQSRIAKSKVNLCCEDKLYSTRRVPLARNWSKRRADGYDVVIIGSGYGGAVTAARLATAAYSSSAKPSICILERGREWLPGTFPDDLLKAALEVRRSDHPLGLYDFRAGEDLNVIVGCGLGGTSLINANAVINPDGDLFSASEKWPQAIIDANTQGMLNPFFSRVRSTLNAVKHPRGMELAKVQQMKKGAESVDGAHFDLHTIAVNFEHEGQNQWNVAQRKCIGCGDCVTGCNVGAKNTLDTNYLAIARNGGAEIFTQVEVQTIEEGPGGGYRVHCIRTGDWGSRKPETIVAKQILVVAAGTLGSTEIMLRSRDKGLGISDSVGRHFSGNGDFFGLAYNGNERADVLGWGAYPTSDRACLIQPPSDSCEADSNQKVKKRLAPGPTIVSRVLYNTGQELRNRFKIEDLSFPLVFVDVARGALALLEGNQIDCGAEGLPAKEQRICADVLAQSRHLENGALNYSMVYLVNGHDDASGLIKLCDDSGVKVSWPGLSGQQVFATELAGMTEHARKLGATLIQPIQFGGPAATPTPGFLRHPASAAGGCSLSKLSPLVTAHPLGGCVMADSYTDGLVNHQGQVYDRNGGLKAGLFIADGAVIPTAIGVNPLLTISMLAERRAEYLIQLLGGTPRIIERIQPGKSGSERRLPPNR
jgi:cholesterol oxidase